MVVKIFDLILPDCRVVFEFKENMPQELPEEQKCSPLEFNLLDHVKIETKSYLHSSELVTLSLNSDLRDLTAQKIEIEKFVGGLQKH